MPHKTPEARADYWARWYEKNKKHKRDQVDAWREANPHKVRAQVVRAHNRRKVRWAAEEKARWLAEKAAEAQRIKAQGYSGKLNKERL